MITLTHGGLSQAESETLYKLLEEFGVEERIVEVTEGCVSIISLDLPFQYSKDFFREFGIDRWDELKSLLKSIKWRRGSKDLKLTIRFNGDPTTEFTLVTGSDRVMGKALDIIEYLVDIFTWQITNIPLNNIKSIHYKFDVNEYKWFIERVDCVDGEYRYTSNSWTKI